MANISGGCAHHNDVLCAPVRVGRGHAQRQDPGTAAAHMALCNGLLPVKAGAPEGGPSPAESGELPGGPAGAGAELAAARPEFAAWADDSGSEAAGCRAAPGLGWASDVIQARRPWRRPRRALSSSFPTVAAPPGLSSSARRRRVPHPARAPHPCARRERPSMAPDRRSVPALVRRRGI
jgi:hypothetical protein